MAGLGLNALQFKPLFQESFRVMEEWYNYNDSLCLMTYFLSLENILAQVGFDPASVRFGSVACGFIAWRYYQEMSHLMTKPTKWHLHQRRLWSAWASSQSDQSLRSVLSGKLWTQGSFMRTAKTLIRLGTQVILLVLSCCSSNHIDLGNSVEMSRYKMFDLSSA